MAATQIVFVDDDPEEVKTFRRLYDGPRLEVISVTATDPTDGFRQVMAKVADKKPKLLVLDMYFPRDSQAPTGLDQLSDANVEEIERTIVDTREVLNSLEASVKGKTPGGKHVLRQAHAVVRRAQRTLEKLCAELAQDPEGGISLLQQLRSKLDIPAVFYSRKATLLDAKRALEVGAIDIISKPDAALESSQAGDITAIFESYAQLEPPRFLSGWLERVGAEFGWGRIGPSAEMTGRPSDPTGRLTEM